MEAYALTLASAALTIAVIALIRTMRHQGPGPLRPLDSSREPIGPVRSSAGGGRRPVATDWLLRVVPRACGAAAVTLVVATFAFQNSQVVSVRFLDWHLERLPLAVPILTSGFLSALAVAAGSLGQRRRLLAQIHGLEHCLRAIGESGRRPHRHVRIPRSSAGPGAQLRSVGPVGKA